MRVQPLYISEGDPVSVSPEIIKLEEATLKKVASLRPLYIIKTKYSSPYSFAEKIPYDSFYSHIGKVEKGLFYTEIPFSFNSKEKIELQVGKPSPITGAISYEILKETIKAVQLCPGDLITLPLSKEWVIASGQTKFTGHTEELGRAFRKKTFMLMYGKTWKILPLTTHIPIKKVPTYLKNISWDHLLEAILNSGLFPKHPKVAFLGLNPHAGEGGKIGKEELEILIPIIKDWQKNGIHAIGPLSADSAFMEDSERYDLVLACYHDQGLIPFKILEGKKGMNLTLGLPFKRLSPAHGTAYEIAGTGKAYSDSLRSCIEFFL